MRVTIAIPTISYERFSLLVDMIDSIQKSIYKSSPLEHKDIHIVIIVDGNRKLYESIKARNDWLQFSDITVILNEKRRGWVASINRVLKEFDSDYYIYASDDLIFPSDCIECAMVTMKECFPDGYGVVTLGRKHKCIFGLVGRKWVEHFPDRQMLCPYYVHYASDAEHTYFAHRIKKFAFPPKRDSQVFHHRLGGETRRFARSTRDKDLALLRDREQRGRLWGIDFER